MEAGHDLQVGLKSEDLPISPLAEVGHLSKVLGVETSWSRRLVSQFGCVGVDRYIRERY